MVRRVKQKQIFFLLFLGFVVTQLWAGSAFATKDSWEKHLVKNDSEIPLNKFRAYYFDEQTAGIVRHSEIVDRPAANFVRDDFHNINAESFGAYWIGYFEFKEETPMSIYVYQSRAESRILIDGEDIYDTASNKKKPEKRWDYTFAAGKHKIEVQYLSNYFSVSFLVNMLPQSTLYNDVTLKEDLGSIPSPSVMYCGAYESDQFDMSVGINLRPSNRPLILFLSSYQPIIWRLDNFKGSHLDTIVVSSLRQGSSVVNMPAGVKLRYYENLPYVYKLVSKGSSSGNKKNTFKNLAYKIQSLTGYKPDGFSGKYGLRSVTIPETVLGEAEYAQFGMKFNRDKSYPDRSGRSRLDSVFE